MEIGINKANVLTLVRYYKHSFTFHGVLSEATLLNSWMLQLVSKTPNGNAG